MGHFVRMSALGLQLSARGCDCSFFTGSDEPVNYSPFDIIIIDTYWVESSYIANLTASGHFVVCVDDTAKYEYSCDILVNANWYADGLDFRFGKKPPILLTGSEYTILREEFINTRPLAPREDAGSVFVCFGGSDLRGLTLKAAEALKDYKLSVALGGASNDHEKLLEIINENSRVFVSPQKISSVMQECDIAVTSTSTICYELAALGIPCICVLQANNQSMFAGYLKKSGLMRVLGDWGSFDKKLLRREVKALLGDYPRRLDEHNRLVKSVNRQGSKLLADRILRERKLKD